MGKYYNNYLMIDLIKNGGIIASALYFENGDSVGAISVVMSLINFYNSNLCSKKYDDEDFALLFLSESKNFKKFDFGIGLLENSYNNFLSKFSPSMLPEKIKLNSEEINDYYHSVIIAIDEKDKQFIRDSRNWEIDSIIEIDIDTFKMVFNNYLYLGYDCSSKKFEDDDIDFYNIDTDFSNVSCSELQDLKEVFELADETGAYLIKNKKIYEPFRTVIIK